MKIDTQNKYGGIDISQEAIATVVGGAILDCYGVAGLAAKNALKDNNLDCLSAEDFSKGIFCRKGKAGYEIDAYVYLYYGVKIPEILSEIQKKVKYELSKTFDVKLQAVNVYVIDIKEIS